MPRPVRHVQDTEPWYRQFWPWFLIVLPATVVVASLVTLYIANRHADDLVVDDYYREGLEINRELEKSRRAQSLGLAAQLRFRPRSVEVALHGADVSQALHLLLSHPLEADRDRSVTLSRVEPGVYRGILERPGAGRWHWALEPSENPDWRLDGSLVLEPE